MIVGFLVFNYGLAFSWDIANESIISKQVILKKIELEKNVTNGKTYIKTLDRFFRSSNINKKLIEKLLIRTIEVEWRLWETTKEKSIWILLDYIQYKSISIYPELEMLLWDYNFSLTNSYDSTKPTTIEIVTPEYWDNFNHDKEIANQFVVKWKIYNAPENSLMEINLSTNRLFNLWSRGGGVSIKSIPSGDSIWTRVVTYGGTFVDAGNFDILLSNKACHSKGCNINPNFPGQEEDIDVYANTKIENIIIEEKWWNNSFQWAPIRKKWFNLSSWEYKVYLEIIDKNIEEFGWWQSRIYTNSSEWFTIE